MSRKDFAEKLAMSLSTIESYETGRRIPSDLAFVNICRIFNVNPEWLETGSGDMYVNQTRKAKISNWVSTILDEDNQSKIHVIEALMELTESEWDIIAKMAKKIAGGG